MTLTYLEASKKLRRNSTVAEKVLWILLRNRQFKRYKFRRQYVIHPYIVDFICLSKKLIIELDGEQHLNQVAYDEKRTRYLEGLGFHVMRFWNSQIFNQGEMVINQILQTLQKLS
jgi:very-short-patch-repair endonuclease